MAFRSKLTSLLFPVAAVGTLAAAWPTCASDATSGARSPTTDRDLLAGVETARRDAPYVVVIDPGHGGKDEGTRGVGLAREKDVVLHIARAMAAYLDPIDQVEVILTRQDDRFVPLDERVSIARTARADLFVSIHANSAPDRRARGAEVYFLSPDGASDEVAKASEDRENAALLVGGASAMRGDDDLLSILVDLQGTAAVQRSSVFAEMVLSGLRRDGVVAGRSVRQANFVVLRTLSMPSVLVEAGFLSHKAEARLLAASEGQSRLGLSLARSVVEYLRATGERSRIGEFATARVHTVRRGDTLWSLARAHGIPLQRLRDANALSDDRLRVGQRLLLP